MFQALAPVIYHTADFQPHQDQWSLLFKCICHGLITFTFYLFVNYRHTEPGMTSSGNQEGPGEGNDLLSCFCLTGLNLFVWMQREKDHLGT
jgi:hypothetical protein